MFAEQKFKALLAITPLLWLGFLLAMMYQASKLP